MKIIFTTLAACAALSITTNAQTILTGGFGATGMGVVNGTTYTHTGNLGSGGYPFVSGSNDGLKFFATNNFPAPPMLYFIDAGSVSFVDSMSISLRNLSGYNEPNTLFALTNWSLARYCFVFSCAMISALIAPTASFDPV